MARSNRRVKSPPDSIEVLRDSVKKALTVYLETNERIASRLFELGKRVESATKTTPFHGLVEYQQATSRRAFDYYQNGVRQLIERV